MRIISLLACLCALLTGCATAKLTHGIPNFAVVEPGVYRGGQPTPEGWAWLQSQGFVYVVKLNTWKEGADPTVYGAHGMVVQDDGIIDLWHQTLAKPDSYKVDSAVQSIVNHAGKCIVYVHCEHGQDRTGLIVAIYRVLFEHWSKADAEAEMLQHGFHKSLHGLWDYWEDDVQ